MGRISTQAGHSFGEWDKRWRNAQLLVKGDFQPDQLIFTLETMGPLRLPIGVKAVQVEVTECLDRAQVIAT